MSENFQRRAVRQGALFEQQCRELLTLAGFEIRDDPGLLRFPDLGVELDAIADNKRGVSFFCEFKGSWFGSRPGLRRTDTVKKALHSAYALSAQGAAHPFVLFTSHIPAKDLSCRSMLAAARRHGVLQAVINVNDPLDIARLQELAEAESAPAWI